LAQWAYVSVLYIIAENFFPDLLIFQRFRLVKFIEKFKTRFKNLKIEKIIAFEKNLHELFFVFYLNLSENLFLTLKNNEVALEYPLQNCSRKFPVHGGRAGSKTGVRMTSFHQPRD